MDEATLERWYADYGYAVHRRCARILQSNAEADDALHEVFLRAYRYGHTVTNESVLGWLYKVADRHCFDVLQRRGKTVPHEPETHSPVTGEPASSDAETRYLFTQVLGACKQRVQEVAVLYYVDELTQEEVAEQLGCSRKTVKEKLAQFKAVASALLGLTPRPKRDTR